MDLHLYPEILLLEVLVGTETIRMKMPYKLAWMPFAEDRWMSSEKLDPRCDDRHVFFSCKF
jgi:hypothetical protein